jgi:hypothetical protein
MFIVVNVDMRDFYIRAFFCVGQFFPFWITLTWAELFDHVLIAMFQIRIRMFVGPPGANFSHQNYFYNFEAFKFY